MLTWRGQARLKRLCSLRRGTSSNGGPTSSLYHPPEFSSSPRKTQLPPGSCLKINFTSGIFRALLFDSFQKKKKKKKKEGRKKGQKEEKKNVLAFKNLFAKNCRGRDLVLMKRDYKIIVRYKKKR